jgi:carboxyl-terminal processing protease
MADLQTRNPTGIVLDLRNNPGGLLHAAEIVLSNFLPKASGVAKILSREGDYTQTTVDPPTIDKDIPMVVLVNKGSASASEIVAGALQDAKRAKVVGEQTFGKGTVQQIIEFRDGSSMKMTIAEWHTPGGRVIEGEGITPDVVIANTETRDEQMLKAMELLR